MVLRHARPHLEIHSRSKGHSAVAGIAYRLGLRLWDERLQVWHDYRKRALGEEVVMALTVAPVGAPDWATDPGELWNRVEASEKRKDSQVARDYRIPVPLGLDDKRAGELAERLARFIMGELGTPVSVGLHRDADTDALGDVKPPDRQGYHAHLYFPSRPLVIQATGDGEDTSETVVAFGARHPMLASKALGRGMVETFNRVWAELATEAAADAGLNARYDHRSYERMGLDLFPQPTIGAGAVALERKGFFTRKGDAVRDIVVASRAYEIAHAEAIEVQHSAARADVARERSAWNGAEPERDPKQDEKEPSSAVFEAETVPEQDPAEVLAGLAPGAPLLERFQALAPRPATPDEAERMGRLRRLVRTLQRALALLRGLAERLTEAEGRVRRARSAKAEAEFELDEARRHRAAAITRADDWVKAHPVRVRAAKLAGRKPKAWADLDHDITFHRRAVDQIKTIIEAQRSTVSGLRAGEKNLEQRANRTRRRIRAASDAFTVLGADLMAPLLAAMTPEERVEVTPDISVRERRNVVVGPVIEERLTYRPPTMRPRP
ncbi:MobA/MobL family protein [Luteibacter sp. UNCMF331Sha3.1]|uniref:MobA/MobL family protein n=1 Tax=Luteibacter sp. UNCMF331Sha3.1 TaxID=1502760 RepID=UPI0008BBCC53|nr:MobA/MobL family protein [Luteibacter sp. UNCMF331Sha3.1]SEN05384.1 MobA/MobL family protein [Luteibacter sp. UNCMF331Sha3.1]